MGRRWDFLHTLVVTRELGPLEGRVRESVGGKWLWYVRSPPPSVHSGKEIAAVLGSRPPASERFKHSAQVDRRDSVWY